MSFIYLASPYSANSLHHFKVAEFVVAEMLNKGIHTYSPVIHCHQIAQDYSLPKDFTFWKEYNFAMIEKASEVLVLGIPGWRSSQGVTAEIKYACDQKIQCEVYQPPSLQEALIKFKHLLQ